MKGAALERRPETTASLVPLTMQQSARRWRGFQRFASLRIEDGSVSRDRVFLGLDEDPHEGDIDSAIDDLRLLHAEDDEEEDEEGEEDKGASVDPSLGLVLQLQADPNSAYYEEVLRRF